MQVMNNKKHGESMGSSLSMPHYFFYNKLGGIERREGRSVSLSVAYLYMLDLSKVRPISKHRISNDVVWKDLTLEILCNTGKYKAA